MALYDVAVGDGHQRERGAILLTFLGNPDPGRFRDAWVEKGDGGEPVIAIYTRNGGGNRESYEAEIQALQAHPLYLRDADDDFDSTYATFYFRCPDEPPGLRAELAKAACEPVDTDQRWHDAIERMRTGDLRPAEVALGDQLGAMLSDPSPDGPRVMEV